MKFMAIADSDIGIVKDTNQDSLLIKHADTQRGEVLLAIVCDGMGGLTKGEVASATVIKAFSDWFDTELEYELENPDMRVSGGKWSLMLKDLNARLLEYGKQCHTNLGTTFTGMLFIEDNYVIVHVGDTRAYQIGNEITQLTTDQTFVAREIERGTMTPEQAKKDKRRNMLLQCVGASEKVEPEIITGTARCGSYMLCSDGFRHEISAEEIRQALAPERLVNRQTMHKKTTQLIEQIKARQEKDNISVILIKAS